MIKHIPVFLTVIFLAGCSNGNVSLKGKVTFSDDDNPLSVGTVCFESDSTLARGDLNPDGTFVVGTLRTHDGLPPGNYRVYITGAIKPMNMNSSGKTGGTASMFEPLVDQKFLRASTSGLSIDVTSSTKVYNFSVDRNPNFKH